MGWEEWLWKQLKKSCSVLLSLSLSHCFLLLYVGMHACTPAFFHATGCVHITFRAEEMQDRRTQRPCALPSLASLCRLSVFVVRICVMLVERENTWWLSTLIVMRVAGGCYCLTPELDLVAAKSTDTSLWSGTKKKCVREWDLEQRMNNIFFMCRYVWERKRLSYSTGRAWVCVGACEGEKGCLLKHCLYGYTLPGDELYVGMEWPSRGHEMSVSRNPTEPGVIVLRSGCLVTPLQPTDSEKWSQHWGCPRRI